MKRAIAWIGVWIVCLIVAVWALLAIAASAIFGGGRRANRLALGFDQAGNVAGGGDEDESFSARCWRLRADPRYARWQRRIDRWFRVLRGELDHCRNAFEGEKARRARPYTDHTEAANG